MQANYDGNRISWSNRSVRTSNVCFGEALYQPGGDCGPRTQRDFQLVILHSGECLLEVGNARHELRPGLVYLLRPGRREYFHFPRQRPTRHSWCSIKPDFLPAAMRRQFKRSLFAARCSDLFNRLLASALHFSGTRSRTAQQLVDQLRCALFACFDDLAERVRMETMTTIASTARCDTWTIILPTRNVSPTRNKSPVAAAICSSGISPDRRA
jgi:hypothetical protein